MRENGNTSAGHGGDDRRYHRGATFNPFLLAFPNLLAMPFPSLLIPPSIVQPLIGNAAVPVGAPERCCGSRRRSRRPGGPLSKPLHQDHRQGRRSKKPKEDRAKTLPLRRSPLSSSSPAAGHRRGFLDIGSKAEDRRRRRSVGSRSRRSSSQVAITVQPLPTLARPSVSLQEPVESHACNTLARTGR